MTTEVMVAIIALVGVTLSGGFAILNLWVQKRLNDVKRHKSVNDITQVGNDMLEVIVPLFEKKDLALDRLADILNEQSQRLSYIESENKQFMSLLGAKCQAPELIKEVRAIQQKFEDKNEREAIIAQLIKEEGGEEQGQLDPGKP